MYRYIWCENMVWKDNDNEYIYPERPSIPKVVLQSKRKLLCTVIYGVKIWCEKRKQHHIYRQFIDKQNILQNFEQNQQLSRLLKQSYQNSSILLVWQTYNKSNSPQETLVDLVGASFLLLAWTQRWAQTPRYSCPTQIFNNASIMVPIPNLTTHLSK